LFLPRQARDKHKESTQRPHLASVSLLGKDSGHGELGQEAALAKEFGIWECPANAFESPVVRTTENTYTQFSFFVPPSLSDERRSFVVCQDRLGTNMSSCSRKRTLLFCFVVCSMRTHRWTWRWELPTACLCSRTATCTCSGEYICICNASLRFKMGGRPILSARLNVETAGSERKRPEI
jgi:hypothetical protein